jgi:hypothetical protein
MLRNLYRSYLYIVYIALLVFIAIVTGRLLNTLLSQTPLRGLYASASSQAELMQSLVFAVVAWVIAGILGGLHYWLIRRDVQSCPTAGANAIRAFFLNLATAIGITLAVPLIGFAVLAGPGYETGVDVTSPLAFALATFAVVLLLELERRRTTVREGLALTFQRLHFYGVQMILLFFFAAAWFSSIRIVIGELIFSGGACHSFGSDGYCTNGDILFLVLSLCWFAIFWLGYGWFIRNDHARALRLVLHGISLAYAIGLILVGVYLGVQVMLLPLFKLSASLADVLDSSPQYDFVSPLALGMLVAGVYLVWLQKAARQGLVSKSRLGLMEWAIAEMLSAASFWWGWGYLLYNCLQQWATPSSAPAAQDWIKAIALVIAGCGYVPLEAYLRRRNAVDGSLASGPRRSVVLALLAGGVVGLAIGGATVLYAWGTTLLGSAITDWQQVAHLGLAAAIISACLVTVYLWSALREHHLRSKLSATTRPLPAPLKPSVQQAAIEAVLDELLGGKVTRHEAAARICAVCSVVCSTDAHFSERDT